MIKLALGALLGAALAVFLVRDAGVVAMIVAAPFGASLLALTVALFGPGAEPTRAKVEDEADSIRIYLAAEEIAALDHWRQSQARDLTRAEAARMLVVKPLLDRAEGSK